MGGPDSKANAFEAGIDDRAVLRRAAHHRRPHEKARLEGLGRGAVAVEIAAVIGAHEDVGAALQFGVDAARRFEFEGAGPGAGDVGQSMPWRANRSRVRPALSTAWAIARRPPSARSGMCRAAPFRPVHAVPPPPSTMNEC